MPKIFPSQIPAEAWLRLSSDREYPVRLTNADPVYLRLGGDLASYVAITRNEKGLFLMSVAHGNGDLAVIAPVQEGKDLVLGRVPQSDLPVPHAAVSRRHLQVRVDGEKVVLRDLGSTNGTFIAPGYNRVDQ